jgi:HK97 family phage prohead protease
MPYTVRDQFGEFTETIAPGAFAKATREAKLIGRDDDVFLYVNHRSTDVPMARLSAGTLKLSADPHLRATATLDPARPDVQIARSAVTRGELTDMSIGFTVNKGRDTWNSDYTERVIHEVNLREVSIVAIGANPFTSASMRSLDEWLDELVAAELTEAQITRGFQFFQGLLPAPAVDEAIAARDRADRDRLRLIAANAL